MSSLVVGCGIPQDQHDVVVSDLGKAQQELQSVKTELTAAQGKVSELTSSLEKAKSESTARQAELETTQGELEKTQGQLKTAEDLYKSFQSDLGSLLDSLDGYLVVNSLILDIAEALPDDLDAVETAALAITGELAKLNDPELQALWEVAFVSAGGRWDLYFVPFEKFIDKNLERIASKTKALRDKLQVPLPAPPSPKK